jgi:hypothetical protein
MYLTVAAEILPIAGGGAFPLILAAASPLEGGGPFFPQSRTSPPAQAGMNPPVRRIVLRGAS